MDASEREQYRAAIHGDREAFEMIIRTHSRTLFAIAYGILQNREEAEDVVQDSLVKAWKTRWRVRDPEKFPAWMATIARHRAHDVFRKPHRPSSRRSKPDRVSHTTALDQQLHSAQICQSFTAPRLRCVISKKWIIAPSKIPWV
jgi:RNA polymerase sigma-70 factor (ECF subfamily)